MIRVLVTAAGGSPAIGYTRSLKAAPEEVYTIGIDANKYNLVRAETDEKYLVPKVKDPDYLPVLRSIIEETKPDLLHVQVSSEMLTISAARDKLGVRTFLPDHQAIEICEDKLASQRVWEKAGLPVPRTIPINNIDDLKVAFLELGPKLWIRATRGSAGKDSLPVSDLETARCWIDFKKGWGRFTAAECLEKDSITWQSIWKDGELIVAQGRKRLYWEFSDRAPSGVTGVTGAGETVSDPVVDEIAMAAILAADPRPNGIYGVDLTYDRRGVPNLTEINIGRFFTTHQFFTAAGLNMPYIALKAGLGHEVPPVPTKINPLRPGLLWIRGMDVLPVLTDVDHVNSLEQALEQRRKSLLITQR